MWYRQPRLSHVPGSDSWKCALKSTRRIYLPFSFQAITFWAVKSFLSVWVSGNQLSVKVKIAELQEGFWSWSRWKPTQTGEHYQAPSSADCDIFTCDCRVEMKAERDALGSSGQSCAAAWPSCLPVCVIPKQELGRSCPFALLYMEQWIRSYP